MMEDGFPASLLLVAGLLKLAAAPRSEPWSVNSTHQSFLEEGLVTAESHLVSVRDDHTAEVTLLFESLLSEPSNKGITHLHDIKGTEYQSTLEGGDQGLGTPLGETESPDISFTEGGLLGHQTDAPVTSRPLVTTGVSASKSVSSRQKLLTTSAEERLDNATGQELHVNQELTTSAPDKAERMDSLATILFDTESLETTGRSVALSTTLPLAAVSSGSVHTFPVGKSGTEAEGHLREAILIYGNEAMEKLVTALPEQSQVMSQHAKLDSRTSDVIRGPATLMVAQNASTDKFQEQLLEKDGTTISRARMEQHYSPSVSSPHGQTTGHETTGLRMTEKPTLLTPVGSTNHPFPLVSTPEILSSASLQQSSRGSDIHQSFQPQILFPSQPPLSRKAGVSSKAEEHLHEGVTSVLHHIDDHKTTTQMPLFKPSQTTARESSPIANLQEASSEAQPNASLPGHSMPHLPGIMPSDYGKPHVIITSSFSQAHSTSSHGRSAVSSVKAPSHVKPAAVPSDRHTHSMQGISQFQQAYVFSTAQREQRTTLPTPADPLLLKPQDLSAHVSSERPDPLPPSHAELPHKPDPSDVTVTHAKVTTAGNFASEHVVAQSTLSRSGVPLLSTVGQGEQGRGLGALVPFQVNGQMFSSAAPFPTRSTFSHMELEVAGMPPTSVLKSPSPSFLDHTQKNLPASVSISFYAKTPPPPGQVHISSQSSSTQPSVQEEQQLSTLSMKVSSHTRFRVPGSSVFFMDEPHRLATSAPAHVRQETNGTAVQGGPPAAELHTMSALVLPTSKAQTLASSSPLLMEHVMWGVSANPGATLASVSSSTSSSLSITLLGDLKPQTSQTSTFVQTKPQPLDASTSVGSGAQASSPFTTVSPGLEPQATHLLLATPHIPEEKSEGRTFPRSSLPTAQVGISSTPLPGGSTSLSLKKDPPSFVSPASLISGQSPMDFPLLNSALVGEDAALSTRRMPTLAVPSSQGLPQSFLALTPHLNQSGDLAASNLDSLMANGILGTSPSLQYLYLLVRSAENMVCLQPLRNATPVSEELGADGHGVAAAQEALPLSPALGLPHLSASSLIQMNPSSVIVVKPMFVFLPAEASRIPTAPAVEEEWNHDTNLSFTYKAVRGIAPYASNQEKQLGARPTMATVQHLMRTKSLSFPPFPLDEQKNPEPVFSAVPKSTETGLARADSSTANPFPQLLRKASTRGKDLGTPSQNDIQSPIPNSQNVEGNHPVSLSVGTAADHHHISSASTVTVPVLERPEALLSSTELLSIPLKTSPLTSLASPSVSQMLGSPLETSRSLGSPQPNMALMLHTENHPHGSVIPITPVSKNSEESLNTSSAGNTKLPLEVGHLTPTRLTSHSSLSTEMPGKGLLLTPSEVQYVPHEVSSSQLLPTGKEHNLSLSSSDPHSEAMVATSVATKASSYPFSTLFSKFLSFHPISAKPTLTNENLQPLPSLYTLYSADSSTETTSPGQPLPDLMNHQVHSGLSTSVSSQVSTLSSSAESVMKYNPTPQQILKRRTSLSIAGGQPAPRVSPGETDLRGRDSEAIHLVPSLFGKEPGHSAVWLITTVSSAISPDDTEGSVGLQSVLQGLPPRTVPAGASVSPLQLTTALSVGGGTSVMETTHHGLNRANSISKAGFSSPSPGQDQHFKPREGGTAGIADEYLVRSSAQVSFEDEFQEQPLLLDDKQIQDAVFSLSTSSSGLSPKLSTPKLTTLSSGTKVRGARHIRQRSNFHGPPLHISESLPSFQADAQTTPERFEVTFDVQNDGDFLSDAVSSPGPISGLSSYTSREQVTLTRGSTEEGGGDDGEKEEEEEDAGDEEGDGSVADLPPWDSRLFDWRTQHHRRLMRSEDVFLDGLTVVSDDACSSGNYTTEMRLQRERKRKPPHSPESFLVQIVLRDNRSHPTLSIESCCVTPTARPAGLEAASCCLFPRSLVECKHIQVHQNSRSGVANFTIQLFRMLSHSMVYLHCELSVCLSQLAGCKQNCLENKEAPSKLSNRRSYETLHNVISFGPVLTSEADFPPEPATGSPLTVMLLTALLSLTASVGVMGAIVAIWVRRRQQTKTAAHLAPPGSGSP